MRRVGGSFAVFRFSPRSFHLPVFLWPAVVFAPFVPSFRVSAFVFVWARSRCVCSLYLVHTMKRVPSEFLPPLRRVAQQVMVGCCYPTLPLRPSMDDVTVVAEELVPFYLDVPRFS